MTHKQILISAGETSGEMHAARLAAALRARTGAELFGLGGPRMRAAGVELLAESSVVAVVGISEVARRLPAAWRIYRRMARESARRRPALAVLVDFPDFNLRLARKLHEQGVRMVYFISPQVWAWRRGRLALIRQLVERMICIFPFEEKFYRDAGVPVDYVGHPLVDQIAPFAAGDVEARRGALAKRWGLDPSAKIVALLPGSRPSEIEHNLPAILEACQLLARDASRKCKFLLALAPGLDAEHIKRQFPAGIAIHPLQDATFDALRAANVAIISSGTATVEAALIGTPMVVVYRVSRTTAFFARRMIETPHYAMVNLIAGHRIVPELMQEDFTPAHVAAEVRALLDSREACETMRRNFAEVRSRLGPGGAIERATEIIAGML